MRLLNISLCVMLAMGLLSSCRNKVICPAFQSTYILDDSVRQTYFSYLWKIDEAERQSYLAKQATKDSISNIEKVSTTPSSEYFAYVEPYVEKEREVKKTRYGIIRHQPYLLKNYRMRTVPMENVLGMPVEDENEGDLGEFVASDFQMDSVSGGTQPDMLASNDSAAVNDSTVVIPLAVRKEEPKGPKYLYKYDPDNRVYNMEQVYYNKYFGEQLIAKPKPIVDASKILDEVDSVSSEKGGFFKNLFKRKKVETDSTYKIDEQINNTDDQLNPDSNTQPESEEEEGFGDPIKEEEPEGGGGN